jgi:3-dehydrosphinganine reductase
MFGLAAASRQYAVRATTTYTVSPRRQIKSLLGMASTTARRVNADGRGCSTGESAVPAACDWGPRLAIPRLQCANSLLNKRGNAMLNFRNQAVVITGGSSGLGLELARRLAAQGARLTLIARDRARLERAAEELRAIPGVAKVRIESVDVRDEAAVYACMQRVADADGSIDVLINSAGILREGRIESLPLKDFRDVMEINFFGLLIATRAALPHLRSSRGRLVNIASVAGLTGVFGYTPYCSSKHALVGLTESLRFELAPMGVTVHLVCPGEFDSPMTDELEAIRTPENRAHAQTIPKASVESIAAATLAGIQSNRFFIVPGTMTQLVAFAARHFPGLTRAMGDRTISRVQRAS